jgi:enterochelin esterase-like enzyme
MRAGNYAGLLALSLLLVPALAFSQTARPRNTYRATVTDSAAKYAPQVHADRTVTLSIPAPAAAKVELRLQSGAAVPMKKDQDGVWRVTVGPLEPEVYMYWFVVDGMAALDMSNQRVIPGRSTHTNMFEVPGTSPRFDEWQDVPHGALHVHEYFSHVVSLHRRIFVYVPPQYNRDTSARFPALYLRHGSGGLEDRWYSVGKAGDILDNLLARRGAVPMLIVMPNGYPSSDDTGNSEVGLEATSRELISEIVPFIEKNYRARSGPESRAVAGFSMGATQAFFEGLRHLDTFAWVAAISSGAVADADFSFEKAVPGFLESPTARKALRLLFLSCGTEDPRYPGHLDVIETLKRHGVPYEWYSTDGAHEWKVGRHALAALLPQLFQPVGQRTRR